MIESPEPKFKVGDWVTCVDGPFDGYKGPSWKFGYTFKVGEVSVRGDKSCIFPEQHPTDGIFPRWLRLATPAEIQKVSPQAKLDNDTGWEVGDPLPMEWLRAQQKEKRVFLKDGRVWDRQWQNREDRVVSAVQEQCATISRTSLYLEPKYQYPTYPGNIQQPVLTWVVGDVLSREWLSTQKTYTTDGRLHRAGFRCQTDRRVEEVNTLGWARISDTCTVWLMPKGECEPISPVEIDCEISHPFKTGCRVRRTVCPGADISVGDTGTVTTIHGQGTKLMVRWDKTRKETGCDMKYAEVIADDILPEWRVGMVVQVTKLSHDLGVPVGEEGILIDIDKQCNVCQVRILNQNLWFPNDQLKLSTNNSNNNFSQLKSTDNVSEQRCSGSRNKSTNLRRKVKTIAGEESGESYPARCKVKSKVAQK